VIELSRERTDPFSFSHSRIMFSNLRMSAADRICRGPISRDSLTTSGQVGISSSQNDDSCRIFELDDPLVGTVEWGRDGGEATVGRLDIDGSSSSRSGVWEGKEPRMLVPENRRLRTFVGLNTGELKGDFCGN
jgi:hypothetical protein